MKKSSRKALPDGTDPLLMLQKGDAVMGLHTGHAKGTYERTYTDKAGNEVVEYRCEFNQGLHGVRPGQIKILVPRTELRKRLKKAQ